MHTRSELGNCMWVRLGKIIGKPTGIGHIMGFGV